MRKAKYVVATVVFGTFAALAAACATGAEPAANDEPAVTDEAATSTKASEVQTMGIEALQPEPNACVKNACLGNHTCADCCAGHSCVSRSGCPQLGLACN